MKFYFCHNLFIIVICTIELMTNREQEGHVDSSEEKDGGETKREQGKQH